MVFLAFHRSQVKKVRSEDQVLETTYFDPKKSFLRYTQCQVSPPPGDQG